MATRAQSPKGSTEQAETAKVTPAARPVTCGGLFEAGDVEHGSEGCGRLPRHKGEHRSFLTRAAVRKASSKTTERPAKKARPMSAAKRREFRAELAAAVEAGSMSASDALAKLAAAL